MNTKRSISLFAATVCLIGCGVFESRADTHYVSLDGTNDVGHSYSNDWLGAATEIQWAVDKAGSSDTVVVSNGTYNLTNQISITKTLTLRSFLEQGHGSNDTFINGNNYAGKLITNRCLYTSGSVIIDGFTISNGYYIVNTPAVYGCEGGGGVMLYNGGTLRNCIVQDNTCNNQTSSATYAGGGGVVIHSSGTVTNCMIFRNTYLGSGRAGGVYLFPSDSCKLLNSRIISNSAPSTTGGGAFGWLGIISNCDFAWNSASSGGGLLPGTLTYGCRIYNNTASSGGGIGGNGPKLVEACVISNNTATGNGGGVGTDYGCNFSNCVIVGNSASGAGGGMYMINQAGASYRVKVANCTIYANKSANNGGGVNSSYESTFKNCLIYCNTNLGANGGGVYVNNISVDRGYGTGDFNNCTIVSNQCATKGGGIFTTSTNYIKNSIIYGNNSAGDTEDDVSYNNSYNTNQYYNCCTPVILAPNQGNITTDPLFVDQPNRDYHLNANSPCLNTGSNQNWMTNGIDLEGRTRIRYGTVDMGAYELIISGSIYGFH